jgi:branched-subunit amino acid aminotransferase/4-amino-4-deoxychorismate lyase
MAAVVSSIRRNETSPLSAVKSLNCLDNLLAREDARRRGADEAILLNTRGLVAEGSASNLFLVEGGRLLTPSIESGALPGITRQAALELASAAGLEAAESGVEMQALWDAPEVFLTNSVMEVMPLTMLDGRPVGSGEPGPVTERLGQMYGELVLRETSTT